jgi:glycosyltransferase involved in cell wall biosynthesis
MNWGISVIIPTYNRQEILQETIDRFRSYIRYELGEITFLVGNDGDQIDIKGATVLPGPKRGLGANLNMLIGAAKTSLLFQMDDDHFLCQHLDLNEHAASLLIEPDFGWIRFFLGECVKPEQHYKFSAAAWGNYWRLLPYDELYIPSNRPHLKVKEFHTQSYGMYEENLKLGETEMEFCHRFVDMKRERGKDLPDVFIPMYGLHPYQWAHVGESWQGQGL